MKSTTLVVGGTGKTGRRVVERLRARGLPVSVGSRSGEPPFDWESPATWAPALRNVQSAYVTFYPDLAVPGAADTVAAFAQLAVQSGTRRLVLLSGRGEQGALLAERGVADSGAEWTVLRSAWFDQNFDEGFFLEPLSTGEVALPVGGVWEPFVDADDVAECAVAALTEDGHSGQVYELTGPRLLTFPHAIEEIARASGRKIRFVSVCAEEFASEMARTGMPTEVVTLMRYLFTEVLDGRNSYLADGVRRVLGRYPRDFSEYARRTAVTGIWGGVHTNAQAASVK
jgi:uncharacterized protein YbjT (DUF2867 family)